MCYSRQKGIQNQGLGVGGAHFKVITTLTFKRQDKWISVSSTSTWSPDQVPGQPGREWGKNIMGHGAELVGKDLLCKQEDLS